MARIWNPETDLSMEIPESELEPGFTRVRHPRAGKGIVWVASDQLAKISSPNFGPPRHPPFEEGILDYLREIKAALDPYYCQTLEEWESGFRADTNPEREIAFWLHVAGLIKEFAPGEASPKGREVMNLCLALANNGTMHYRYVFQREHLTEAEVEAIVNPPARQRGNGPEV